MLKWKSVGSEGDPGFTDSGLERRPPEPDGEGNGGGGRGSPASSKEAVLSSSFLCSGMTCSTRPRFPESNAEKNVNPAEEISLDGEDGGGASAAA